MDVLDPLLDPWRSGLDRRALLEVVMLGAFCGALGFWVVEERLTYAAESLSHGLLPGLVLAAIAPAPLLLGAAGGVLVAAALIAVAARDERVGPDTATAVVVTGMVGLGALLALAPGAPPRLEEILFGDPLGVTDGDLVAAAILLTAGGVALAALRRPLTVTTFDAAGAAALGVSPTLLRLVLLGLLAAAVAVAVQGLGALLALAVLVGPPVAVRGMAAGPGRAMVAGAAVGALAGAAGIFVSFHAGIAAGAAVALTLCLFAAAGAALAAYGVTGRSLSRRA
ncbi:MAG TPA: metal ABC transporter permease [Thermoleophilaceae bacterium]|jgi:ABC-type Mn2+/Zn2+ transport system permease subunit